MQLFVGVIFSNFLCSCIVHSKVLARRKGETLGYFPQKSKPLKRRASYTCVLMTLNLIDISFLHSKKYSQKHWGLFSDDNS